MGPILSNMTSQNHRRETAISRFLKDERYYFRVASLWKTSRIHDTYPETESTDTIMFIRH